MAIDEAIKPALRAPGEAGRTLTASQIGCVLNDIAMTAAQIDTLVIELQREAANPGLVDSLAGVVLSLAQRIGWAADMAAERIHGSCGATYGGDAAQWMMPPSFHWDDEGRDETGGAKHG